MRLKPEVAHYFKQKVAELSPGAAVYLFGSRVNDTLKGGDIDILILSEAPLSKQSMRTIRIDFYKQFGWQKLDVVNYTYQESHPFKSLILEDAEQL
jgi:predicted nucleotidyltransferase